MHDPSALAGVGHLVEVKRQDVRLVEALFEMVEVFALVLVPSLFSIFRPRFFAASLSEGSEEAAPEKEPRLVSSSV